MRLPVLAVQGVYQYICSTLPYRLQAEQYIPLPLLPKGPLASASDTQSGSAATSADTKSARQLRRGRHEVRGGLQDALHPRDLLA